MNNFDLSEEMAIANMISALANPQIAEEFGEQEKDAIRKAIRTHVCESCIKINNPITNNIKATPTSEAASLWGEKTEQYHPHL